MSNDLSPTSSRPDVQEEVDLSSLTPQEQKLYKMYGKMPSKKDLFKHKLHERKYFDSGDYALSKAGVKSGDLESDSVGNSHLPVTNPSGLRESIIRRRMSNSASGADPQHSNRQSSISSGPPPRSPNK
ncbi:HBR484Wp [Eremothecium sinecaudum]|uniref:mRNA stability protein n=1 Tax=Eremothecium sinecaudum TaxID=45286 RepID=A0A109UXN3_9SACH|nr:HBR484Wp [Eremothecium sinecaudum]AMD19385.1 HBR484Wp [Eremothecium sinecaudum]